MSSKTAITVNRPPDQVRELWSSAGHRSEWLEQAGATVSFLSAPGDRGTEIHVELGDEGMLVSKLKGDARLPKVKDELRRVQQRAPNREGSRAGGGPGGE